MKAPLFGKYRRGFSTLELMIAFAIMSVVMGGVILADFSANYWTVAAQTSNEGLYKAKTRLEELRAAARQNFFLASSSPMTKDLDSSCTSGSLCYFVESTVTNLSSCSKYAQAKVDWQVVGYPTTTTSLFTHLTNPTEAILLGGDCPLVTALGAWTSANIVQQSSATFSPDVPTGLDTLSGIEYVSTDQAPYFRIVGSSGLVTFGNGFSLQDPLNALDVARDAATGRTYVYAAVASTTGQLEIIDVTDTNNPTLVSTFTLPNMSYTLNPQDIWGRKIVYYDRKVYITTRDASGPELHVIDVSTPTTPSELGSKELGFTVLDMAVRDEYQNGAVKRMLYAATGRDTGEVAAIDVTSLSSISISSFDIPDTGCSLADKPNATSIVPLGRRLYVGREHSATNCPSLPDLYILDISNSSSPSVLASDVAGGGIIGLRASGGFLFAEVSSLAQPTQSGLLDMDSSYVYVGNASANMLQVWSTDPTNFVKLGSKSVSGGARLQILKSN